MPDDVHTGVHTVDTAGGRIDVTWASATDVGKRREVNQDSVLAHFPLFVVADGMGGHIGGEVASRAAVDRLRPVAESGMVTSKALEKALAHAVKDIGGHPGVTDEGTGTTVTGVYFDTADGGPHWMTLNIGDSRVYLARGGEIAQITTDHSVVQELIAAGRLSPEEAENHPYGNVITRAVGPSDSVKPDYVRLDLVVGDRFVVCSDGLTKELTDYGILHFLSEHPDAGEAVTAMMDASLENGGRDNISVIVVNVGVAVVVDDSDDGAFDEDAVGGHDEPEADAAADDDAGDSSEGPAGDIVVGESDGHEADPESGAARSSTAGD